jgi:dihydroxyacid dehydratase/phosphogluconate dehydratase
MKRTATKNITKKKAAPNLRPHSAIMLDGPDRAPSRAMLYPTGFKKSDFGKPIIGVASTWSNVTPCNMHIDELARVAEVGTNKATRANSSICMLHGVTLLHVEATPMIGFPKSDFLKPVG